MTWTKDILEKFRDAVTVLQEASQLITDKLVWKRIEGDTSVQSDLLVSVLGVKTWSDMLADKLRALNREVRQ
jgi:hypothetical protein